MKCFVLSLLALLLGGTSLEACSVPVFRYALERWDRDEYRLIVATKGPPSIEEVQWIEAMTAKSYLMDGTSNYRVSQMDIDAPENQSALDQLPSLKGVSKSTLVLLYPRDIHAKKVLWQAELNETSIEAFFKQDRMNEVFSQLLKGRSAVWLLVEGPDVRENERVFQMAGNAIDQLKEEMQIPAGILETSGKVTGGSFKHQDRKEVDPDNILKSGIPLRIDFSVVRLPFKEKAPLLRSMLSKVDEQVESMLGQTMLVPFFGRGRFLLPMVGKDIRADYIKSATEYLSEACSCQVKAQNPGFDSLSHIDWRGYLEGSKVFNESSLFKKEIESDKKEEVVSNSSKTTWWVLLSFALGCVAWAGMKQRAPKV